jgi:hypothetical protein
LQDDGREFLGVENPKRCGFLTGAVDVGHLLIFHGYPLLYFTATTVPDVQFGKIVNPSFDGLVGNLADPVLGFETLVTYLHHEQLPVNYHAWQGILFLDLLLSDFEQAGQQVGQACDMVGLQKGRREDRVDQPRIRLQIAIYRQVIHDISASEVVFLIRQLDLKAEMLIEKADHEVKEVVDDTGKVKKLVMLHTHLIQPNYLRPHLNFQHFVAYEAPAKDESGKF